MAIEQIEIIILACMVAVACALPGVFLVLRRMSLMSDAISHAILFGIVLAFFYVKDLHSPWLLVGAALTGVLTVTLTQLVIRTRKLKEDAAIGLVFPVLFSIGVILISRYAKNVHLDADCVLFGEIAFTPFERMVIAGADLGPQAFWVIGFVLLLNVIFITVFYKELKLSTFDPALAAALGFAPAVLHYALMTLVSITCVGAFESVGSILVVALMITPPAAAYLLTDRLSHMLLISALIGIVSAVGGYGMAYVLDTNIAGSMATMSGIIFLIILVVAPQRGLLAKYFWRRFKKWDFAAHTLAVHLFHAENTPAEITENVVGHMKDHMLWDDAFTSQVIAHCLQEDLIKIDGQRLILTDYGRATAKTIMARG